MFQSPSSTAAPDFYTQQLANSGANSEDLQRVLKGQKPVRHAAPSSNPEHLPLQPSEFVRRHLSNGGGSRGDLRKVLQKIASHSL